MLAYKHITRLVADVVHCDVTVTVPDGDGISATMTVKNDWPSQGRFEGWLDFDINQVFEGWIMKIHFSKPVTQMNVGTPTH